MNKEIILSELNEKRKEHDLEGVELTLEDVDEVIDLINSGMEKDAAIHQVLNGIYDVLAEGFEY
jgi:hypothetical protein